MEITAAQIQTMASEIEAYAHFVTGEQTVFSKSKPGGATPFGLETVLEKNPSLRKIYDYVVSEFF